MNIKNAILFLPRLDWGCLDQCLDIDEYILRLEILGFVLKSTTTKRYILRRKKK